MKNINSLLIDGKKIFVDQGTTILEAARHNGIIIPTLCYHPRLAPLGHCRMCIVSVSGIKKPVTSCDNPVVEGMVVKTNTPELQEMRSRILELFLATHPYKDCLTCVRTGSCELQEKAYQYQVNLPEQLDREIPSDQTNDNQYLVRDEEKCILCGRCIQVCRSGPGRFVYSMIGNGVNTRVVPYKNGHEVSLEEAGCIFCGQCVDVCPVAALTEKGRSEGGREWELKSYPGVCIECSLGCYLERRVSGEDLIKISIPQEGDRVSWLCRKGKYGFLDSRKNWHLFNPVIKNGNGNYRETDYNDAVKETAARFKSLSGKYGSEALAIISSGKTSNEENYLLKKLARTVMDTANLKLVAEQTWLYAAVNIKSVTGAGVIGPTPAAISSAESILIIGSGLEESHPVASMAVGQAGRFGDSLIIRTDPSADDPSAWKGMVVKPGKAGYKSFLSKLKKIVEGDTSAVAAKYFELPVDKLKEFARLITAKNSYIVVCPSFFNKADQDTIDILIDLAKSCGQIEPGRNNLLLLSDSSNAAGLNEQDESVINNHENFNTALQSGNLKGLLMFGSPQLKGNLDGLEFLAVICDAKEDAPPGADVIFPTQPIIYKNGTYTNSANQVRINQAMPLKDHDMLQDWRMICDLACAMGAKWSYKSLDDVREEMKGLLSL